MSRTSDDSGRLDHPLAPNPQGALLELKEPRASVHLQHRRVVRSSAARSALRHLLRRELLSDGNISCCMLHDARDKYAVFSMKAGTIARRDAFESHDNQSAPVGAHAADRDGSAPRPPGRPAYRRRLLNDTRLDDNVNGLEAPTSWAPIPVRKPAPAANRAAADLGSSHVALSRTTTFAQAP